MCLFLALLGFTNAFQASAHAEIITFGNENYSSLTRRHAPEDSTYYLHLGGTLLPQDPHSTINEIQKRYTLPLDALNKSLTFSWTMQAEGNGGFFVNLIVEPTTENDRSILKSYLVNMESMNFHGLPVRFVRVESISEKATLEAGNYDEKLDDPFSQTFSLSRNFRINNLAGWASFTNQYGFALLNHNSASFLSYLAGFVGDDLAFQRLLDEVLSKNNMVAIDPEVSLRLEGGDTVGRDLIVSPFLPFKFFRNCYAVKYENGACYQK
jgi:hypothetical protein